ncbi:inositol monophosphatase family protein [Mangrovibacterium diazotrophicum]|uniref:3'(2'), 5'-bisphosphate nucleotidase/myo-inositol-1(Or 4)-monophosphatase n=1 Tax=Mangrovibacterium diazotrophicum TaxID=1261403 RepID=A0A419WA13_9BACT|nr:inositol monophosphatase family protein [Mangrovibacterium diazotrophicum]RKD92320.1 3'(2'), 5'-bisphosphate nucleotidase/myo-inositol-1(or 4)-monophosphatase [Mangrovibacterium diazotrophicum]
MQLTDHDLQMLREAATSAALKAGNLISSYATKELDVKRKGTGDSLASDVVTEVDVMAQEIILGMLEKVTKIYDLGTLGEESEDNRERFEKDYFWAIDPIDGTLPFINREHGYSTSIALVSKEGEPVIGVILDPMTGNLYYAVKGQGAFFCGLPWKVEEQTDAPLSFLNGKSMLDYPLKDTILSEMETVSQKLGYTGMTTQFQGGAALIACWVLEKAPACYFYLPKKIEGGGSIWDFAASACIFKEAGAWISDIYGNPLDLNRAYSTFMNHRGVVYATSEKLAKEIIAVGKKLIE